jgi:D-aminopeptidase
MLPNERMTPLFDAVVEATEEAIVNALCAAETMTGLGGSTAYAIPLDRLATLFGPAVQEPPGA